MWPQNAVKTVKRKSAIHNTSSCGEKINRRKLTDLTNMQTTDDLASAWRLAEDESLLLLTSIGHELLASRTMPPIL